MNTLFKKKELCIGLNIEGKWNKKRYIVIDVLGSGENGIVYLVKNEKDYYALKMCELYFNLSNEVIIINNLCGTQESFLGFSIFDVDDFNVNGEMYSFYVMPYEEGITINKFLHNKTAKDFLVIYKEIVQYLSYFHKNGFVYGDIKAEHILINPNNMKISFIDIGGVTKFGEGIKQYTEINDRGSWKIDNRKADAHYDLFSLSMVFIQISLGEDKLLKIFNSKRRIAEVCGIIQNIEKLKYLSPIIKNIFNGRLRNSNDVTKFINRAMLYNEEEHKWIYWLFANSFFLFVIAFLLYIRI